MKNPTEVVTNNTKTEESKTISAEDAKVKTAANLQDAFNGESNATARYAAFLKKPMKKVIKKLHYYSKQHL